MSSCAKNVARLSLKVFITLWQAKPCDHNYPQSSGKLECFHKSLKGKAVFPKTPPALEDAKRITVGFIDFYNHNTQRLHSAISYIAPADRLAICHGQIHAVSDKSTKNPASAV